MRRNFRAERLNLRNYNKYFEDSVSEISRMVKSIDNTMHMLADYRDNYTPLLIANMNEDSSVFLNKVENLLVEARVILDRFKATQKRYIKPVEDYLAVDDGSRRWNR